MEVCIRMQKAGRSSSKRYHFRIVAIKRASSREGRVLDILGYYDPSKKPALLSIDHEKVKKWVAKGAVLSDTIRSLVKKTSK